MSKVILITGTSTGLGISLAVQAAQAGHVVYATMRNLAKREALEAAASKAGVTLRIRSLDVQDMGSITNCIKEILAEQGRIDVLINNAGAGFVRSTEQASLDDINWVMDVNFMGVVRCTKAVLPHMRQARSGHVVTIGSVGGLIGQPFNEIYCGAKFAVEGYMESLACYVGPAFNLDFTTVEPGGIKTEFAASVLKHVGETGGMLDDEYLPILQAYVGGSAARQDTSDAYQSADDVAKVVMDTIAAPKPPVRCRTSAWAEELTALKTSVDPDGHKVRAMVSERFLDKPL